MAYHSMGRRLSDYCPLFAKHATFDLQASDTEVVSLLSQNLQEDGYDVGEIPEDEGALMQSVLNDPEAKYNSADLNVAYKMKVDEYQKLCPYAEALEENWGKPPGTVATCITSLPL